MPFRMTLEGYDVNPGPWLGWQRGLVGVRKSGCFFPLLVETDYTLYRADLGRSEELKVGRQLGYNIAVYLSGYVQD
jgi:hypothetical protein